MHTKHGLALEPVQLFLNLITAQSSVDQFLVECRLAFRPQAILAQEQAGYSSYAGERLVGLDDNSAV